jgi:nucleoside-diphosphate-sugar epimerase
MRILVTGHLGYIGSVLVPRLLKLGHALIGCDTDLYAGSTFGAAPVAIDNIRRDIRDLIEADFVGIDAVVHLAGLSNDPLGNLDPALTDDINHRATIRMAGAARAAGVSRFLFSSSCSTYGAAGDSPIDELAPFNPQTPYGQSKVDAETNLAKLANNHFSPVYLRNATAYGDSPRLRFDLVVNNLVAWALTTGQVRLKSRGLAWRPLVHVEDICAAFEAALRAPHASIHNQAFNIGRSEDNIRIHALAQRIVDRIPGAKLTMADGAEIDARTYRVDCSKAEQQLPGFTPCWDIDAGVEQLITAIRERGLTLEAFEGPRYQRLAHLLERQSRGQLDTALRPVPEAVHAQH